MRKYTRNFKENFLFLLVTHKYKKSIINNYTKKLRIVIIVLKTIIVQQINYRLLIYLDSGTSIGVVHLLAKDTVFVLLDW